MVLYIWRQLRGEVQCYCVDCGMIAACIDTPIISALILFYFFGV